MCRWRRRERRRWVVTTWLVDGGRRMSVGMQVGGLSGSEDGG